MNRPTNIEALFEEATRRSGRPDIIEYPVPQANTVIVLCRLTDDDHRKFVDGVFSQDEGVRATARNVALAAARVWPDQATMNAAISAVPGLDKALVQQMERLGGGDDTLLRVIDVRSSMDDSLIASLGVDPAVVAQLRKEFPNEGQLKIAAYNDEELEIKWSCVLRLPSSSTVNLMFENMRSHGHETTVTFAVNSMAWPNREAAPGFVRGKHRVGSCLWSTLFVWANQAAKARPTILRPKSNVSATLTALPILLEKSSETSA